MSIERNKRWPYVRKLAWNRDRKLKAVCHICGERIDYTIPSNLGVNTFCVIYLSASGWYTGNDCYIYLKVPQGQTWMVWFINPRDSRYESFSKVTTEIEVGYITGSSSSAANLIRAIRVS